MISGFETINPIIFSIHFPIFPQCHVPRSTIDYSSPSLGPAPSGAKRNGPGPFSSALAVPRTKIYAGTAGQWGWSSLRHGLLGSGCNVNPAPGNMQKTDVSRRKVKAKGEKVPPHQLPSAGPGFAAEKFDIFKGG
eukprot:s138_g9.t1